MGSRKSRGRGKQNGLPLLIAVGGALCALWFIATAIQQTGSGPTLILIVAALAIGVGFYFATPQRGVQKKLSNVLERHLEALTTRRAQLTYRDAYGNLQTKRWNAEIDHFLNTVLTPELSVRERRSLNSQKERWANDVDQQVAARALAFPPLREFSETMTPSQYEAFCAEELKRYGWDAAVTKGSRDQGVDVVASKAGVRVVLQCKLYSQPVGNKAVQEVVAARNYERARFGIVVSNNSYTAPAQALASTNGVHLLHHRELAGLEALLRKSTY